MVAVDLRAPQVKVDLQHGDPFTLNVVSTDAVPSTLTVWIALRQSAGTPLVTLTGATITGGRSYSLSDVQSLSLSPSKAYQLVARDSATDITWFTGPVKPSTEGASGPTSQTVTLALSEAEVTVDITVAAGGGSPTGGAGGALSGTYPNPGLNTEAVQDLVAAFIDAGTGVTVSYDDEAGSLTISATATDAPTEVFRSDRYYDGDIADFGGSITDGVLSIPAFDEAPWPLRLMLDDINLGADRGIWIANEHPLYPGVATDGTFVFAPTTEQPYATTDNAGLVAAFGFNVITEAAALGTIINGNGALYFIDNHLYTPAVGADWADPDPTTFPAALDALAAAGGGGASLSDSTPADLGTAAAGVATDASRSDHVHDMPTASDVGAQPVDSDLTTIAGLTAATDSFMQAKSGAWSARTVAQVRNDMNDRLGTFNPSGRHIMRVGVATTVAPSAGQARPHVMWLPAGTIDGLGVSVSSPGTAGTVAHIWMYTLDNYLRLGDLFIDAGSVAVDASSILIMKNITATAIDAGLYGFAVVPIGSSATQFRGFTPYTAPAMPISVWGTTPDFNAQPTIFSVSGLTGTAPSAWSTKNVAAPGSQQAGATPEVIVRYQ